MYLRIDIKTLVETNYILIYIYIYIYIMYFAIFIMKQ